MLEQFSLECRKTKTKVITWPINTTETDNSINQSELEANTCSGKRVRASQLILVLSRVDKAARGIPEGNREITFDRLN